MPPSYLTDLTALPAFVCFLLEKKGEIKKYGNTGKAVRSVR